MSDSTTEPEPTPDAQPELTSEAVAAPRPTPALIARRPPRPAAPMATTTASAHPAPSAEALAFGRVADDGTVYVREGEAERAVGSYPGASAEEALGYFGRKFDELVAQVALFEQRLSAPGVTISEVDSGLTRLRKAVAEPDAVGDLQALRARIEALAPLAATRKAEAEAERGKARAEARARRTALVEEAEQIAATPAEKVQWRAAGQRMKDLFEQWRTDQRGDVRLDRPSQEELWKRFTHARNAFDRSRRQHFAHLDESQGQAKAEKEALVREAEALQTSTDWAATAPAYKRLMDRWRESGRAARKDDDALWARFRAAQDVFFAARDAASAETDKEYAANLEVKLALLEEAEKLVPVRDLASAKAGLRSVQDRWEAAGKVPRADMERVDRRLRTVEQAVRESEDARWTRRNPEGEARARSAVDQLEAVLADLTTRRDRARAAGDERRAAEAEASIAARQGWLEQAQRALRDFGG